MNPSSLLQIGGIVLIFVIMYMLMIRPQKKREKQVNEMRSALKAGDKITTIGGIKGKIVTAKDDSLVIQVGVDKVKMEIMRWAVSKIDDGSTSTTKSSAATKTSADKTEDKPEEEKKPARKPMKLTAKTASEKEDDGESEDEEE